MHNFYSEELVDVRFTSDQHIITTQKQTDILLGRDAFCNSHFGNILFWEFCSQQRDAYMATISRIAKSRVAIQIMEAIYAEGGQFLRQQQVRRCKEQVSWNKVQEDGC
jgi:hypothetical protein